MNALEDLDSVPWNEIASIRGSSTEVPLALQGLLSDNVDEVEKAYWSLDNVVVVQSDLYESAYYVIRFLIQMLKCDIKTGRAYVYDLLFELANGYAPDAVVVNSIFTTKPLRIMCIYEVFKGVQYYESDLTYYDSNVATKSKELLELLTDKIYHTNSLAE